MKPESGRWSAALRAGLVIGVALSLPQASVTGSQHNCALFHRCSALTAQLSCVLGTTP